MAFLVKTQIGVLLGAFAVGCTPVATPDAAHYLTSFRQERELLMRERWAGRLYADLVSEMGRSGHSMTTPSAPGETHSAVIFGVNDPISGCVDSFDVINGDEPIVNTYYCR